MMNKRGMEMSVGLIVVIILSVLIFSLSLYYVFKWFGEAEALKAEIDKQTQEQIMDALKTGNRLVAIPLAIQDVGRGKSANFGVGIRNIGDEKQFSLAVGFSGAYTPDGKDIPVSVDYINSNWIGAFSTMNIGSVKRNEQKIMPFLIKADLNTGAGTTPKGDYVFNVCVYSMPLRSDNSPPAECSVGQFNAGADNFYTSRIYQITVKVV